MNVGIIGSGGREHALCLKIKDSNLVKNIYCFPGNAGTSLIAKNIEIDIDNFKEIKKKALEKNHSQVLWLNQKKISEVGTMNIFFLKQINNQ